MGPSDDSSCPSVELIARLVDGDLSEDERGELQRHVDACPVCTAVLAGARGGHTPSEADNRLEEGRQIGPYQLRRPLGAGASADVFEADDKRLSRRVAIKVLRPQPGCSSTRPERLLREARVLALLNHPSVVAVYDVGVVDDRPYVVMELVQGQTLRAWLAACERHVGAIVSVFAQIARGLGAAHAAGVVHRDVKPDNIFVRDDGSALVGDFGLAGFESTAEPQTNPPVASETPAAGQPEQRPDDDSWSDKLDGSLTATGTLIGTPVYSSPEHLRGDAGVRSDQFSLCVALYEALFGERPFVGNNLQQLRERMSRGVRFPSRPRLGRRLRRAIGRGLDPDPARRFRDMEALAAELQRATGEARHVRLALAVAVSLGLAAAVVAVAGSLVKGHPQSQRAPFTARIEVEGTTLTGPMVASRERSTGFIHVPQGTGNVWIPKQAKGRAVAWVEVPAKGDYFVWGRLRARSHEDNSFFIRLGEDPPIVWDTRESSTWVWDRVRARSSRGPARFALDAGRHQLTVIHREDGAELDALVVTSDPDRVPPGGDVVWQAVEAEDTPQSQRIHNDRTASDNHYVALPAGGTISHPLFFARDASYALWVRARSPSGAKLTMAIDHGSAARGELRPATQWRYQRIGRPGRARWPGRQRRGEHVVTLHVEAGDLELDRYVLTDDETFVPVQPSPPGGRLRVR